MDFFSFANNVLKDSTIKFSEKEKIIRYTHFVLCILESSVCDNLIKI